MNVLKPLTVLLILTTLIACDDITTPDGNTPAYVLELLEESFNRQGISVLDGVLSTDFVFYFDPKDVGKDVGGFIIPLSWNRDDHMTACGNMFEQAYSINFNINTTLVEDPEEGATTFEANDVPIRIVVMVDATNGFLADGFCDFELTNDDSAGYDDWKVSKWYDDTSPRVSTGLSSTGVPSSLGSILARYY